MHALFGQGALFEGLDQEGRGRLSAAIRRRTLERDEYLFLLGDSAADFFVLARGKVDLCLPMRIGGVLKDVSVESVGAGEALGWSALVKPYRFTLSARATEPSEVICLARRDLLGLFEADLEIGYAFFTRFAELVGIRLLAFQALWVRELQRAFEHDTHHERRGEQEVP